MELLACAHDTFLHAMGIFLNTMILYQHNDNVFIVHQSRHRHWKFSIGFALINVDLYSFKHLKFDYVIKSCNKTLVTRVDKISGK